MSFKDIKGQTEAITFLKHCLETGRLSHAYIFTGLGGIGKRLTALNFAKAVNCLSDSKSEPCEECASCRKVNSSLHPDVIILKPEKDSTSIGIDEVRELIRKIGMKPYEAKKKVYIIDEADSMTTEAQNAFLKTLEEPPPESILILITKEIRALLATIQSRAQIVKFFPLRSEKIKEILTREYKVDESEAQTLSNFSSGSLGQALEKKEEDFFEKRRRITGALANNTFLEIDFDDSSKRDLKLYLDIMLMWYRDMLVIKSGLSDRSALANSDQIEAISNVGRTMEIEDIDKAIRQIIMTGYFLERNANPRLAMSALGANLCMK